MFDNNIVPNQLFHEMYEKHTPQQEGLLTTGYVVVKSAVVVVKSY